MGFEFSDHREMLKKIIKILVNAPCQCDLSSSPITCSMRALKYWEYTKWLMALYYSRIRTNHPIFFSSQPMRRLKRTWPTSMPPIIIKNLSFIFFSIFLNLIIVTNIIKKINYNDIFIFFINIQANILRLP